MVLDTSALSRNLAHILQLGATGRPSYGVIVKLRRNHGGNVVTVTRSDGSEYVLNGTDGTSDLMVFAPQVVKNLTRELGEIAREYAPGDFRVSYLDFGPDKPVWKLSTGEGNESKVWAFPHED